MTLEGLSRLTRRRRAVVEHDRVLRHLRAEQGCCLREVGCGVTGEHTGRGGQLADERGREQQAHRGARAAPDPGDPPPATRRPR